MILAVLVTAIVCVGGAYAVFGGSSDEGESVSVAGSTSVQPLMGKFKENYEKYSSTTINVTGGGSSAGAKAAIDGTADIGMLSRDPKPAELEKGLMAHVIAYDGVAVIVNSSVTVSNLTLEQIGEIFSGDVKDWSDLGGAAGNIAVASREDGSGTRDCFDSIVGGAYKDASGKDFAVWDQAVFLGSTGAVISTVSNTPNSIGYISLGSVGKLGADAKAISIDGVEANPGTVLDKTYKVQRNLVLVTKGEPKGAAAAFLNYIFSADGKKVIESEGFVNLV